MMAMKSMFVTGTDTDCGKTRVAAALIARLVDRGLVVAPMKPVASGVVGTDDDDSARLIQASGREWSEERVSRYRFAEPIAPHIAARQSAVEISPAAIREDHEALRQQSSLVVMEGAGGWAVPLGDDYWWRDVVTLLDLPVVLVVGLRVGALNHAILSARAILDDGARLVGWIANQIDPDMAHVEANIATLERHIAPPLLATMGHGDDFLNVKVDWL